MKIFVLDQVFVADLDIIFSDSFPKPRSRRINSDIVIELKFRNILPGVVC